MSANKIPEVEVLGAFRNLIAYFLERQRLVVLAMLDISPVLLTMEGADIPDIDLKPYIEVFEQRQEKIQSANALYHGIWKAEWRYRLHGIGCKLVHLRTKEPIEWDAPQSRAFRFDWFWQHLVWRLENEKDDPYVRKCSIWLSGFLPMQVESLLVEHSIIINIRNGGLYLLRA